MRFQAGAEGRSSFFRRWFRLTPIDKPIPDTDDQEPVIKAFMDLVGFEYDEKKGEWRNGDAFLKFRA